MRDDPRTTNEVRRPAPWRTTARVTAVCGLVAVTWLALPAPAQALGSVRTPESVRALDSAPAPAAVQARPSRALRADEVTKYYVVKSAQENGGEQETLFGIAQRTLGDGDRFEEILVLNSGRQRGRFGFRQSRPTDPGLPTDPAGGRGRGRRGVRCPARGERRRGEAPRAQRLPHAAPRPAGARDRSPGWATGSGRPG